MKSRNTQRPGTGSLVGKTVVVTLTVVGTLAALGVAIIVFVILGAGARDALTAPIVSREPERAQPYDPIYNAGPPMPSPRPAGPPPLTQAEERAAREAEFNARLRASKAEEDAAAVQRARRKLFDQGVAAAQDYRAP